jgi:hypothetical protein
MFGHPALRRKGSCTGTSPLRSNFVGGIHLITRVEKAHAKLPDVRHRCFVNFITNMISTLIACNFLPEKP